MTDQIEATYFLRVIELRTPTPPDDLSCMKVEVIRVNNVLYDQVQMNDARVGREEWMFVRPHGYGWLVHDTSADRYTVYRRPHVAVHEREHHTAALAGAA